MIAHPRKRVSHVKLGILQRRSAWPLRKDDMLKHEMVSPLFFLPPSVHCGPAAWLDPHGQLQPPPPPPPPRMCALTTVTVTVTAQWDGASVTRVATYSPPADRSLAHEARACSASTIACARCTEVAMVRPHVGASRCCESTCLAQTPVCPGMAMCTKCTHRESISGLVTVCRHSRQLEILKKLPVRGHRRHRHCCPMLSMAGPVPHTPTRTPRAPCAAGHGTRMMGVSGYIP